MIKFVKTLSLVAALFYASTGMAQDKPNILVIWGDDVGWFNTSAYNRGMMGYRPPISTASRPMVRCLPTGTDSRAAPLVVRRFITGQSPFRTGLLKVGLPGAKEGLSEKDPTIAGLLQEPRLHDRAIRQESSW